MKGKSRKKIVSSLMGMLLLFWFGVAAAGNEALAASAVVSLSTGEEEVVKGDVFSVMVTVESADDIGNVEMFVSFDSSRVSFIDNGKYTIGGEGLVLISDWDESKNSTRKKYALEFKAKNPGACRFAVGDQPAVFLADSDEQMSVSSINMSVNIIKKKANTEAEEDKQDVEVTEKPISDQMAELQNIIVGEGQLVPEFNPDITSYAIEVPNDVERLSMSALTTSADADVTIKGNENFVVGENIVTIVVEAANGAKREYSIAVVRSAYSAENPDENSLENEPEPGLHTTAMDDKIVITQYVKLTVKKVKDETLIPTGYMKTSIRLDGEPVIAYMLQEDMDSEAYLIYGTDGNGYTGFYEYNRVEGTLKPYVADYGGNTADQSTEIVSANFQMMTAIFVLLLICAVLSVALVLTFMKQKRKNVPVIEIEEEEFFKDYL